MHIIRLTKLVSFDLNNYICNNVLLQTARHHGALVCPAIPDHIAKLISMTARRMQRETYRAKMMESATMVWTVSHAIVTIPVTLGMIVRSI